MKKGLVLPVLFAGVQAFAAECPDAAVFKTGGVALNATVAEVQAVHGDAVKQADGQLELPQSALEKLPQVTSFSHIHLDKQGKVDSYAVRYAGGSLNADALPAEALLAALQEAFAFPVEGFVKEPLMAEAERKELGYREDAAQMVLHCKDYTVEVAQDFSEGRQALGPRMLVYRHDSASAQ